MKYTGYFLLSLLAFFQCQEETLLEKNSDDSKKIIGKYENGAGFWINGSDEVDQINFTIGCDISKKDGYYLLKFDDHPVINLPELNLKVFEIHENKMWGSRVHYFHVDENLYFYGLTREYSNDNTFFVAVERAPNPFVSFDLYLKSKETDSLYYIQYSARHSY